METIVIQLPPDLEDFVRHEVRRGNFKNAQEYILFVLQEAYQKHLENLKDRTEPDECHIIPNE